MLITVVVAAVTAGTTTTFVKMFNNVDLRRKKSQPSTSVNAASVDTTFMQV